MSTALKKVDVDSVPNMLEQLEEAFFDIPFENSDYQTRAFVIASQQTPARAYRSIGLKMFSKIRAVKDYMFDQKKKEIDLEEKRFRLQSPDINQFEKRRIELEIIQLEDGKKWGEKLLNDSLHELSVLQAEFDKFPKYSRAQFEAEEEMHFDVRLRRQIEAPGAMESLLNMREDLPQFEQRIKLSATHMKQLDQKD